MVLADKMRSLRVEVLSRLRAGSCDARLVRALEEIRSSPLSDLRRVERVESLIGQAGLARDDRGLYGLDERWMNPVARGLWQIPRQLAEFLVWLADHRMRSFLEIGTYTGHTFAVVMTYLTRFNPDLMGVTVDPARRHRVSGLTPRYFEASYVRGKSDRFAGRPFDVCFIDGEHRYQAVARDFHNVGRHASICAFHDINDEIVETFPGNEGGVPRFWREVIASERRPIRTFCYHSEGRRVMGIGAIGAAERRAACGDPLG
jgi:hypothetical protein